MHTYVYMVRHGDSPKEGNERTRGLTKKGLSAVKKVTDILIEEDIDIVISSPYIRSILTVEGLAKQIGKKVLIFEDLKERKFFGENNRISDKDLFPLLEKSYCNHNFSLEEGESNRACQKRAIKVLKEMLELYRGKKIVIGTHGAVMTLMMGYFDHTYNLDFLHCTSKPDIYRMEFSEQKLVNVERLWDEKISIK